MRKSHEIIAELNAKMKAAESAEGEARAALLIEIDALTRELQEAQIDEAARRAIANQRVLSEPEKKELQRFSISKFLRELRAGQITGFEAEMEKEGRKEFKNAIGKEDQGVFLPSFIMRDLTYSPNASEENYGQALITESLTYVEALRKAMVCSKLGVRYLDGLVGNLAIAKAAGATAAWITEEGTASASKPTYTKAVAKPHRLQIIQGLTYDLLHSSSLAVDSLIMDDLRNAHAEALDAAILAGPGSSGAPTGVINTSGVGTVAMGTTGAALSYEKLVEFETIVGAANALMGSLAYVTNSKVLGKMKTTPQVAGYPVWLAQNGLANEYPLAITNSIPSDYTKSTGSGLSGMIFGNFNEVLCCGWGGLQFILDPYSEKEKGVIEISAHAYHDVLVRRPAAFAVATDIATA